MVPKGCIDKDHEDNIVLADHDPTQPIGNATVIRDAGSRR